MWSKKTAIRVSVVLLIMFWVLFSFVDLIPLLGDDEELGLGVPEFVSSLLLACFILALGWFYKVSIGKVERVNFINMLWRVFVFSLMTAVSFAGIEFLFTQLGDYPLFHNTWVTYLFYHACVALMFSFLVSTLTIWKRLILYHKSSSLLKLWQVYEYGLIGSLIFDLFSFQNRDIPFLVVGSVLGVLGFVLSFNLKWVAYLNFKQKLQSALFILFVMTCALTLLHFLMFFSKTFPLGRDLLHSVFTLSLIAFIAVYAVVSLLVLLFNLPTSSVFEKKLEEVVSFHQLSQSIPVGENEQKVYETLLESSVKAVYSEAAWLQIDDAEQTLHFTLTFQLDEARIPALQQAAHHSPSKRILNAKFGRTPMCLKISANIREASFRSILIFPIIVREREIGSMALLKKVNDGFNKEMIHIIDTFIHQAKVSVENFRLLNAAIVHERYKEELEIAKRVQRKLLPTSLGETEGYDMAAFSEASDEVGGDYYDIFHVNDHRTILIIGDVSGKGTSAAFHTAQMKGVFQSLARMDMDPKTFFIQANHALSVCLEKNSFITASYFVLDSQARKVTFARAGHSPSLYYSVKQQTSAYFRNKGMGLGILRNSDFQKHVQVHTFEYQQGDILALYTDGITEARNPYREQFGYERLQNVLNDSAQQPAKAIQQSIIAKLYEFCESNSLDDDYTLLITKFD